MNWITLFAFLAPVAKTQKHLTSTDIALWVVAAILLVLILMRRRARKAREREAMQSKAVGR